MKAILMTAEQVKADPKREYNQQVWENKIDSISTYGDVQFYKVPKDDVKGYDSFYAVYTIPEGIRLFNEVGYSSSLTNTGFTRVTIDDMIFDWSGEKPIIEKLPAGEFRIEKMGFYDINGDGSEHRIANNPAGRKWMAEKSLEHGTIFTNIL
jgi:hypothetical protein